MSQSPLLPDATDIAAAVAAGHVSPSELLDAALAATAACKFLPQPGAVLIKDAAGHILGSAGASGGTGDEDELICIAGIKAAGLVAG